MPVTQTHGKIMIVEDEKDILELVRLYLENTGFATIPLEEGSRVLQLLALEKPDMIILDIGLPDCDGVELCREIRKRSNVPILFLTCRREAEDMIAGLETGGDDYMTKPFDPAVLVARVKANLRRVAMDHRRQDEEWRDDNLAVNLQSFEVFVRGHAVPLLPKERQLLLLLVKHENQVFSVEQLYERIWGWDSDSDDRTVMVHISNLRKKIEADPTNPRYIRTVRGFGYKFQSDAS